MVELMYDSLFREQLPSIEAAEFGKMVISGSAAFLLIFPFRDRNVIYSDAIVTTRLDLRDMHTALLKFISEFIQSNASIGKLVFDNIPHPQEPREAVLFPVQ